MAKKLSQEELRKLATDFDPPSDIAPKAHGTSPLNAGKRVRVTTNLAPEDYAALKALARRRGLSMSAVVAEAVYTLLRAK